MAKNISESNIMVGKLVAVLVALLLVAVLVYPVINTVGNGGGSTGTTIDNEGAEWLKLGYAEGTDFEFVITNDGTDVTVGEQTGPLGDMIYYADENRVIFSKGTTMYLMTAGDNSNTYTFNDSVSVTNSNGTITIYDGSTVINTASSPARAYYPDASGGYGFFTNGNLNLLENELKVAVGSYAGVFAYNENIATPDDVDLGLVMTGDYATGDVTWAVSSDDESNDEPPVQPLASQPSMVVMGSASAKMQVMGTANPTTGTQVGDLYYTFSGSEATIVGYASSLDVSTLTTIPDTIVYNNTTYTITAIGDNAFEDCYYIALTHIPSGVTSIGDNAFKGCNRIAISEIPSGVTHIGDYAFAECVNLNVPSLPSGLTTINAYAFQGCYYINWTSLPSGITYIGDCAFSGCTNLALTSLPSGVTYIGTGAFSNCTNLALTSLPANLTSIGTSAFNKCTGLTGTLVIPSSVTSINTYAFQQCSALTTLEVMGSPTIGANAFKNCTKLKTVVNFGNTPITTTSYGLNASRVLTGVGVLTYSFNGTDATVLGYSSTIDWDTFTSIPDTVTYNSTTYNVTVIGNNAFQNCTSLALTSIPAGITNIAGYAFKGCTSLTTLSILGSPTIGNNAFQGCTNLKTIYNYGTTPITTTSYGLNADVVIDMNMIMNSLTFSYDDNNLTATVTGYTQSVNWSALTMIPDTVEHNGATYTITAIGNRAFEMCWDLNLTSLPSGLTSIGNYAFNSCWNLTLTELPSGVTSLGLSSFATCKKLALTSLPSGLTYIPQGAFNGCTNLALTSLPSGLTGIGVQAFQGCTNLTFTSLPSGITNIGMSAFKNCTNLALTELPTGLTAIRDNVFEGCPSLALTEIPAGITSIGNESFKGCTSLTTLSILGSPTIGTDAFAGCDNLKTIYNYGTTPITTTSYGLNADTVLNIIDVLVYTFDNATSTATVTGYDPSIDWTTFTSIPNTVTYGGTTYTVTGIGTEAFKNCTNLALTSLPSGLTSIEVSTFQGCTSLALTSLPAGLTSIGNSAFFGCTSLALTSLPSGLTSIGNYTFFGCTNLALTSLPSGVTSIGISAFNGCTSLALTSIPADVTIIGGGAFQGCSGIKSMIFLGSPTIENYAFFNTGIKEVLNLGDTAITTTSYGLNADSVQDYVSALGYVAPTHVQEGSSDSGYDVDGVSMAVLKLVPIILMVCILLVLVMPMIQSRTE